jgi:uncharacterized protein
MQQLAPVSSTERLETLDVVRGFALLGILMMNIRAMAAPMSAYMYPYALFDYEGPSRFAYLFTSVFFDLKMMGIFSMLFGAGVLLYANKRTASGASPRALWFKRMFVLLVIGLVHAYLIWAGDILVPYALCGILLLWWMRNRTARTLLVSAVVMLAIGAAMAVAHWLSWDSMGAADRAAELEMMMPTREQARGHIALMLGPYTRFVAESAPDIFMFQTMFFLLFFLWRCGGMMLLGMSLYKSGFLDGRMATSTYARVALVATPVGLALALIGAVAQERVAYAMPGRAALDLWNYVGAVFASIGYTAMLIWIVKRGMLGGLRRRLAAVGQMAFSNYLFHSVTASVLFLGWGFGLAGRFDYAAQLLIVLAIWIVQLVVSPIWLQRFRFGPAEWFWRTVTYGQVQPMRRDVPASSSQLPASS